MPDSLNLPALVAFLRQPLPADQQPASLRRPTAPAADPIHRLELLAAVLGCPPSWLLTTGRVTLQELAEAGSAWSVGAAARLIRSHGWEEPPAPEQASPSRHTPAARQTAITRPATWRAARDAYLGHVMACPNCRAHLLHNPTHCPPGLTLRQAYDSASG